MKAIKLIVLLAAISVFTSIPSTAEAERDCSDPKGFHATMMCKLSGKYTKDGSSATTKVKKEKKKKERCSTFAECWGK